MKLAEQSSWNGSIYQKEISLFTAFLFLCHTVLLAESIPSLQERIPGQTPSKAVAVGPVPGKPPEIPQRASARTALDFLRSFRPLSTNALQPLSRQQGTISKKNTIPQSLPPADPRVISTYTLDPEKFTAGTQYAKDTLSPDWTNSSGKVVRPENGAWNQLTTQPINYFNPDNFEEFVIKSRTASKDAEVDTWMPSGMVFLRLTEEGKAIYFLHSSGGGKKGHLEIGIATGVKDKVFWPENRYRLYENNNLDGTVEGYSNSPSQPADGDYFTFGVDGFDIYAKFNGKEIVRFKDYRHVESGKVGVKVSGFIYLSKTSVRHLKDAVVFSNLKNNILDLRDFGLREVKTTGSMKAGSNQLVLSTPNTSLKKGDTVIVEIGGEANQGKRGTRGVGGSWPDKSYASVEEMQKDKSMPLNTYAWLETDSRVYQWTGSSWVLMPDYEQYVPNTEPSSLWYYSRAIPRSLRAKILDISLDGTVLTLEKNARVDTSSANVYLDNAPIFRYVLNDLITSTSWRSDYLKEITPSGMTLRIPEGSYAIGEEIFSRFIKGWKIEGAGSDKTKLFSPKGVPSASIVMYSGSSNIEMRNFHLQGNLRDEGHGLMYRDERPFEIGDAGITQTEFPQREIWPYGIRFDQSPNGLIEDMLITDVTFALNPAGSDNTWAKRVRVVLTDARNAYASLWLFNWSDSKGGGCIQCSVESPELVPAYQSFKSTGTQFIDSTATNGLFSCNSCGDFLLKNSTFRILPNSGDPLWKPEANPIITMGTNVVGYGYELKGGIIENVQIVQEGYVNSNKDVLRGIVINDKNPNITVKGGIYFAPDYAVPSRLHGALGLDSTAINTTVDGFRVIGKVAPKTDGYANINIKNGIVKNSIADRIRTTSSLAKLENNLPNSNKAPIMDVINSISADEGNEVKVKVTASDPNGSTQKLIFSLEPDTPEGATINSETGEFTWTPKEEQDGNHRITVKVTDSGVAPLVIDGKQVWAGEPSLSATRSFIITVNESNTAPVIQPIPDQVVEEGKELRIPVIATDSDKPAQALTYLLDTGAPQGASIDTTTGLFTWTPTFDQGREESYGIGVNVTDGKETVKLSFKFKVNDVKRPLTLEPIADQVVKEKKALKIQVKVRGEGVGSTGLSTSGTLIFVLESGAPEGASIDPMLGEFTWIPNEKQGPGTYPVTVKVIDQNAPTLSATTSFNIKVQEVNEPPIIADIPPQAVKEGERLSFKINVSDSDLPEQKHTFSLEPGAPEGMMIHAETGEITWTPKEGQGPKDYTVTVRVTDSGLLPLVVDGKEIWAGQPPMSATRSFNITVRDTPKPEPEKPVTVGGKIVGGGEFLVTVAGEPNKTYRIESTQDFSTWTALGTVTTNASGSGELPDPSAPSSSLRFYRAVTV